IEEDFVTGEYEPGELPIRLSQSKSGVPHAHNLPSALDCRRIHSRLVVQTAPGCQDQAKEKHDHPPLGREDRWGRRIALAVARTMAAGRQSLACPVYWIQYRCAGDESIWQDCLRSGCWSCFSAFSA